LTTLRVGVDVGGTFTKAVAVSVRPVELRAQAVVPTSHHEPSGVAHGVAEALRGLFAELGDRRDAVQLVAYSTTQAMNALLEGDVATVGVIGIGAAPELRVARKRTRIGAVKLAPGRSLRTEHEFLDATRGLAEDEVDAALSGLRDAGCRSVAVSGAFAVDAPEHERLVVERAHALGLYACAGHELTGTYGLETRTVSAAINASILHLIDRTATIVEGVLADAGLEVPLLVLRGDGGAMGLESFRKTPSLTIGSGPAAGVAAALHELSISEAIVVECGGTSSNVSIVKGGQTAMRTLRVMGHPTAIRSVDSWVVGAAGGSMARLGRRRVDDAGPRSAHVAGLPYACFAEPDALAGARAELVAPVAGDPERYAVLATPGGDRYAVTATCAAYALGRVEGDRAAALAAFEALASELRQPAERAAEAVLGATVAKISEAVGEAARAHGFGPEVPVVALGGAGRALAPDVARAVGRPVELPANPDVLSSIGATLSLVRVELARHGGDPGRGAALTRDAELACVEAGAAPQTVRVETRFEPRERILRAVATGALALEQGAAERAAVAPEDQLRAASAALGLDQSALELVAHNDYYRVFSENGSGGVAVVDVHGSVPLAEQARRVIAADGPQLLAELPEALREASMNLGVAQLLPRVALVCGSRIVDMSDARHVDEVIAQSEAVIADAGGRAVAVIWR
jgi:N-methylhydantoinase A